VCRVGSDVYAVCYYIQPTQIYVLKCLGTAPGGNSHTPTTRLVDTRLMESSACVKRVYLNPIILQT